MNEIFNFQRFGWLLKKTLLERPLQIFGILGISFVFTWFLYHISKPTITINFSSMNDDFQSTAFGFGLVLGGGILAGTVFAYFSESAKGYGYLTLPASYFEKWLSGLFIMLIFTVLFISFFRIIDTFYINNFHAKLAALNRNNRQFSEHIDIMPFGINKLQVTYMFYFLVTGAMAVGAFYFNKMAVIKTAIACIVAFTAVQLLNSFIANIIFGELVGTGPFMNGVNIRSDGNWRIILPHQPQFFFKTLFLFILPIAFWLIALIRLREKEF